jgi:hypothetical protein
MISRHVPALVACLVLVAASPAVWAQETITYDPFDVIAGALTLPSSVNVSGNMSVTLDRCPSAKLEARKLTFDQAQCPLFRSDPLPEATLTLKSAAGTALSVKLLPRPAGDGGDGGFVADDEGIKVTGLGNGPVAVFYNKQWRQIAISSGKLALDDATRQGLRSLDDRAPPLYIDSRGSLHRVEIVFSGSPKDRAGARSSADEDAGEFKCDSQTTLRIPDDAVVVCVDAASGQLALTQLLSHVILPNKPIVVVVRYREDKKLRVEILGKRGLFLPGLRDQTPFADVNRATSAAPRDRAPALVTAVHSFAPRRPGDADIRIALSDGAGKVAVEGTVELSVEETYLGALRLGIAPIFGGAIENRYGTRMQPEGTQREIVATTDNALDMQLVLGMSPFVFDWLADRRGRSYFTGLNRRFAPYVGLGLLNAEENSLKFTPSLHAGLELELTPQFSIAVTAVGRNVSRLAPGFEVGSVVDTDEVPTITGFRFGWGVVFNFSPEFLRLAARPGSSFFGK